jgi:hypothetical protein
MRVMTQAYHARAGWNSSDTWNVGQSHRQEERMARYSRSASKDVKSAMKRRKSGKLKSGKGGKVKSRKQAIAIGLSEARKKVPKRPTAKKTVTKKAAKKKKKTATKKRAR